MPKDYFGERVAERYDEWDGGAVPAVVDPIVDFLAEAARGGAALELGIGTGRIALPLARRDPGRAGRVLPERRGAPRARRPVRDRGRRPGPATTAAPIPFRYVWPSELDLMARLAGMTLRERWAGWEREPFTSKSRMHVSVWE